VFLSLAREGSNMSQATEEPAEFEFAELWHVGMRVIDLEAAKDELTAALGVTWTLPMTVPMTVWTPEQGYNDLELSVCFSREGPLHLELMQGSPGSYYETHPGNAGLHHLGIWVKDVTDSARELVHRSWAVELAGKSPEDGYGNFAFIRSPDGPIVEPQSYLNGAKERMARWFATGSLAR
jgi:hypothetical protein